MGRIIINNRSKVSDQTALMRVKRVMEMGRISNDSKQYCYVACFNDCDVFSGLLKNGDKFDVLNPQKQAMPGTEVKE